MNKLEVGKVFTALEQKEGSSEKGGWEFLKTKDEKGGNHITVFVKNRPSNVKEGASFRIEKIYSVSCGARKDSQDRWYTNVSIEADVTPVSTMPKEVAESVMNKKTPDFFEDPSFNEDELPF